MRLIAFVVAMAALAAPSAFAAPLALPPAQLSPEAAEQFSEDYGMREVETLREMIATALETELERRGATFDPAAGVSFNVTIIKAKPNKPTMEQMRQEPGLDYLRSVSLGGAELQGVFVGGDDAVLATVSDSYFSSELFPMPPLTTWEDAWRAIHRFAAKAADAYVASIQ
jgi:hypothetical protein